MRILIPVSLLLLAACGSDLKVVGSCKASDQYCSDFVGAQWNASDLQATCGDGNFSESGCESEGLTSSCRINEGQPGDRILRMYGVDPNTAQANCDRLSGKLISDEQ